MYPIYEVARYVEILSHDNVFITQREAQEFDTAGDAAAFITQLMFNDVDLFEDVEVRVFHNAPDHNDGQEFEGWDGQSFLCEFNGGQIK